MIVLLHGFTQTGAVWKVARAALESLGHEVATPDLPGHGNCDPGLDGLNLWQSAEWLVSTYGEAFYVGYSMGARIGLHAALSSRDVQHLVCIGARMGIEGPAALRARREVELARATRIEADFPGFLESWMNMPHNQRLPPEAQFRSLREAQRPEGLAATLRYRGQTAAMWPMKRIPATFVYADDDLPGVAADARRAAEYSDTKAIKVRNCGHAIPFEKPDEFMKIVLAALAMQS